MLPAFLRRWALLFSALFAVTSPLQYRELPSLGFWLRPMLEAGLRTVGGRWLPDAGIFSDSAGLYGYAAALLLATALVAALWAALARRTPAREAALGYALHTGAAWFLALQLLEYGLDKVFKHQFYLPEPNTLYTPLGLLPPDLAYWSVMGASRSYSVFAGLLEVLPAALLLFRRTRLLGGLLAVAVLANVLALNVGFEITVKLWSGFLLALAAIVAAPGLRTVYGGLVRESWCPPRLPIRPAWLRGRWVGAARGLGLGLLLVETAGPFVLDGTLNDDLVPRPLLHGAYAVVGTGPVKRVFVHRQGYFITQTADDSLRSYRLTYAPNQLLLRDEAGRPGALRYSLDSAGLHLAGILGHDSVRWLARPLPWRALPLLQ
ncbi:MAG: hypothetical protein ACRYFX_11820 [Janthinobacterium lividum]